MLPLEHYGKTLRRAFSTRKTFERYLDQAMEGVVQRHAHDDYEPTRVCKRLIDGRRKRAAFVLCEQIDSDRLSSNSEGWLGDQFRYSVWLVDGYEEPSRIHEDHGYTRPITASSLTGTRGRDASIDIQELSRDGVLARISPEQNAGSAFDKITVKIGFDGTVEEPDGFTYQAENLVSRVAPKLGYDSLRCISQLDGKDVAAAVFGTEDGSTDGYDTVYLVWKSVEGELRHKQVANSAGLRNYLSLDGIREEDGQVVVSVNSSEYRVDLNE